MSCRRVPSLPTVQGGSGGSVVKQGRGRLPPAALSLQLPVRRVEPAVACVGARPHAVFDGLVYVVLRVGPGGGRTWPTLLIFGAARGGLQGPRRATKRLRRRSGVCVGAAGAFRWSREADAAPSSVRADGPLHQQTCLITKKRAALGLHSKCTGLIVSCSRRTSCWRWKILDFGGGRRRAPQAAAGVLGAQAALWVA